MRAYKSNSVHVCVCVWGGGGGGGSHLKLNNLNLFCEVQGRLKRSN